MNIVKSNGISYIGKALKSTLNTINSDVGQIPETLIGELAPSGFIPTGPMMFLYKGLDGKRDTQFDLTIALPVSQADAKRYEGELLTGRLEPFSFVERVHYGDISELDTRTYEPLHRDLAAAGIVPNGEAREIYQNFIGPDAADNETRVQVGVVA